MRKWMQKLLSQFELESPSSSLSEDRATLLYIIDVYNKNLLEIDSSPVRKVREILDEFTRDLIANDSQLNEKTLFRFRQFFSSYRIEEYSYVQKTFEDFRSIVWDFVDQLAQDFSDERKEDLVMKRSLEDLKEAVEANSIDSLRTQARHFINSYVEIQSRKQKRRSNRVSNIKKNLDAVKKKLHEANETLNVDHLTRAQNRKAFDEAIKKHKSLGEVSEKPTTLLLVDIDHFKKINDTFGHAVGDFVLQECVALLKKIHNTERIYRIGGEEFALLLPECSVVQAKHWAEETLKQVRAEAFVQDGNTIRFTVSIGIAELEHGELAEEWIKRADAALYQAKNTGRNKYCVSGLTEVKEEVA